ncbi:MAG: DUF5011 domain-containing protein [Bacteroidetes bacterium]|nr:DUF5011 domain-containing protein [Bacteroidota bacterium]
MKFKNLHLLSILVFFLVLIISSCSKDDVTAPTIVLTGSSSQVIIYKSSTSYIEPGFTATDETDGDITANVVVTGTVDVNSVGTYSLVYSVTDQAGNSFSVTRTVVIDANPLFVGNFSHIDIIGGVTYPATLDTLAASFTTKNKILFKRFSGFSNAAIFANLNKSAVTIPAQTYYCGDFPSDTIRTFQTIGTTSYFTVVDSIATMVLNYSIIKGTDTIVCSSTYTKQ